MSSRIKHIKIYNTDGQRKTTITGDLTFNKSDKHINYAKLLQAQNKGQNIFKTGIATEPTTIKFYCIYSDAELYKNVQQLTPVFEQGVCGSCWSISSSDATSLSFMINSIRNNVFYPFNSNIYVEPLAILTCLPQMNNYATGCNGGDPTYPLVLSSVNYLINGNYNPLLTTNTNEIPYYSFDTNQIAYIGGLLSNQCLSYKKWCNSVNCEQTNPQNINIKCDECNANSTLQLKNINHKYTVVANPANVDFSNYYFMYRFYTQDISSINYLQLSLELENFSLNQWQNLIMNHILQVGPVIFSINVYNEMMNYYPVDENDPSAVIFVKSGIAIGGHSVICVGWKIINGQFCWIIKNSWGNDWGIGQNFTIEGINGFCFIASDPSNLNGVELGCALPNSTTQNYTSAIAETYVNNALNNNLNGTTLLGVYFAKPNKLYLSSEFDEKGNSISDSNKVLLEVSDLSSYNPKILTTTEMKGIVQKSQSSLISIGGHKFTLSTTEKIMIGIAILLIVLIILYFVFKK